MTGGRRLLAIVITAILQAIVGLVSGENAFVWSAILTAVVGVAIEVFSWVIVEGGPPAWVSRSIRWLLRRNGGSDLPPSDLRVVQRPELLKEIVSHLVSGKTSRVGLTTALLGAGGFGKTTMAYMAAEDPQVKRHFRGGRHWITIGDELSEAKLAGKINDLTEKLTKGVRPSFVDPELAGGHLRETLAKGGRSMLIIDDVWRSEQLSPFLRGSGRCVLLVTTRKPDLLEPGSPQVRVDQVSRKEAAAIIRNGLAGIVPEELVNALIVATGRWPLLLNLVNGRLHRSRNGDLTATAEEILERFHEGGPAALDVLQTTDRSKAVAITIRLSTSHLTRDDAERFTELGIFAEDEPIPADLIAKMWRETGGLSELDSRKLVQSLVELSLARYAHTKEPALVLHDVIRDYLRYELASEGLQRVITALLTCVGRPLRGEADVSEWWRLPEKERFLWKHLPSLMASAGLADERNVLVTDLRWVGSKLRILGLTDVMADLEVVATERAASLRLLLVQHTGQLKPTDPADSIRTVLFNRLRDLPEWEDEVRRVEAGHTTPSLVNIWPMPDAFDQTMRGLLQRITPSSPHLVAFTPQRTLLAAVDSEVQIWDTTTCQLVKMVTTGDPDSTRGTLNDRVTALTVAPSGSFFATATDQVIQLWDASTGELRKTLRGHQGQVEAVSVAPDSSWLASAGGDLVIRVWDAHTGAALQCLEGHQGPIRALAISPDHTQVATAAEDHTIRLWSRANGRHVILHDDATDVRSLSFMEDTGALVVVRNTKRRIVMQTWDIRSGVCQAEFVAPLEAWLPALALPGNRLAAACSELTVRVWDARTGEVIGGYGGHTGSIAEIAATPDGNLLATAARDGDIRLWDVTTVGAPPAGQKESGGRAVVAAGDGSWFAASGDGQPVRIWDVGTKTCRAELEGHLGTVFALAVTPDGNQVISGGDDRTIRLWNLDGSEASVPRRHANTIRGIATAPNGEWFAAADTNGVIGIWDYLTSRARTTFGFGGLVAYALAVTPGSDLLVAAGGDQNIHMWDTSTWTRLSALEGHTDWVRALSASPDGMRLASAGRDHDVRLWNIRSGTCEAVLKGHGDWVHTVAFSPDGRYLASAGRDREIRIWDTVAPSQPCVATMRVAGSVRSCAWLRDRELIAAGAGGIYVFRLQIPA